MNPDEKQSTNPIKLDDFLTSFKGRTIVYCPNPGNAGDSLICAATLLLFARHDISVKWVSPETVCEQGEIVVYGGGGNLVSGYEDCRIFMERNHRQARRMILLSHSVAGNEDLLASLGPNVDLILREPISFRHCLRHALNANVYLGEDTVLELDVRGLMSKPVQSPLYFHAAGVRKWRVRRVRRMFLKLMVERLFTPWRLKHLQAFRTDGEALPNAPKRSGNKDLSDLFCYKTMAAEEVWLAATQFMVFLQAYQHIHTDRLHIAIAACLLDRKVSFYPNSYFKNEAVYLHSLKQRFPKLEWMAESLL